MKSLVDETHSFILAEVIAEYESRITDELSPIKEKDGDERPSYIIALFKCYDKYELYDLALSCLTIEALISSTLRDNIQLRFGHYLEFDDFPGQIYFIMVLGVSNVSIAQNIENAVEYYKTLKLATYPGQNIYEFVTNILRHIKIM